VVDPLIHELGSVGIAQAINCYANELPKENADLADALFHSTAILERSRPYRNYYIHGISNVSSLGWPFTDEAFDEDKGFHEYLKPGPFGMVWLMSGKHRTKWIHDFVAVKPLDDFAQYLGRFHEYLEALFSSVCHYFRRAPYRETAPIPQPLPLLSVLEKMEVNLQRLHKEPALDLDRLGLPPREKEE
jgi:hypothetical protein